MAPETMIRVLLVHAPAPRQVEEMTLELPPGSTLAQALAASGLAFDGAPPVTGIWGRKVGIGEPLRDGDRIEIYRPLRVDPKVARRERFQKQGTRGAGLFAQRRPGAKAGY